MLVGGFNLGGNNKKFRNSGEAAKRLIKSFIFLRQNLERVSERDAEELTEILRNCSEKFEKIVQRIKDEN
jgi:hypothetical protein